MGLNAYIVVNDAYAAWKSGDLKAFGSYLASDVAFDVPASAEARTYVGKGEGRDALVERLRAFLDAYEVREFKIASATPSNGEICFRVHYDYCARSTGEDIQGVQRHVWTVRGNEITSFTVIHDARRLGAFFELTAGACA